MEGYIHARDKASAESLSGHFGTDFEAKNGLNIYSSDQLSHITYLASEKFAREVPAASAKFGLTSSQRGVARCTISVFIAFFLLAPEMFSVALFGLGFVIFVALIVFRLALAILALSYRNPVKGAGDYGIHMHDNNLPIYTILVPLFHEAAILKQCVEGLEALNYPKDKLDIKLLIEADDNETYQAVIKLGLAAHYSLLILPKGKPQTKPRALNYGLALARGEYVTVYDAEDRPDPDQLRKVLSAFYQDSGNLACIQVPLQPYNGSESWIAGQFNLEYGVQFLLNIPGLAHVNLPIMLGGTSNHFPTRILQNIQGWDPYNVTEDADLGLRLARQGYTIQTIPSYTLEEAPIKLSQWLAQRSRWLKGHTQTWLVIMREPIALWRAVGFIKFLAIQCLLGGVILSAILHGLILAIWIIALCIPQFNIPLLGWLLIAGGYTVQSFCTLLAIIKIPKIFLAKPIDLCISLITMLFYWPLQSLAMVRALYALHHNPHYWVKTQHGLSCMKYSAT